MNTPTRDERLAKALRDNLARRKARARAAGAALPLPVPDPVVSDLSKRD